MSNESINNEINVGALSEAINEKMDRNLANTDAIGQAILDKKIEVEALLAQNGYAKFTWKEGNKISKLIIQWGTVIVPRAQTNKSVTFSTTFLKPLGMSTSVGNLNDSTLYFTSSNALNVNSGLVVCGRWDLAHGYMAGIITDCTVNYYAFGY